MLNLDITQLYDQEVTGVYRYVLYRIRHVQATEDIVSEIFRKVMESAPRYQPQPGATVRSWLYSITRNTLIDYVRRQQHAPVELDDLQIGSNPHFDELIDQQLEVQTVFKVLQGLPEQQRECLLLRFQADLRNKEIAHILGLSEQGVAAAITRGIANLKKQLTRPV